MSKLVSASTRRGEDRRGSDRGGAGDSGSGADAQEGAVGQFITFYLDGQIFALPVTEVLEIHVPERIYGVPLAPPDVAGVINLRGRIVTVIDMRHRLQMPTREGTLRQLTCVTVRHLDEMYGLLVDKLGDVLEVRERRIEPVSTTVNRVWRQFAAGIVPLDKELLIVLRTDSLLRFGKGG